MIRQTIDIKALDWQVMIFYAVDTYYVDEIMSALVYAGAKGHILDDAFRSLSVGKLNSGLTYSGNRHTVMVTQLTSSAEEFFDSFIHELEHVASHIIEANGIDPYSEDAAYLKGDLARLMFRECKTLMCDCCRHKHD